MHLKAINFEVIFKYSFWRHCAIWAAWVELLNHTHARVHTDTNVQIQQYINDQYQFVYMNIYSTGLNDEIQNKMLGRVAAYSIFSYCNSVPGQTLSWLLFTLYSASRFVSTYFPFCLIVSAGWNCSLPLGRFPRTQFPQLYKSITLSSHKIPYPLSFHLHDNPQYAPYSFYSSQNFLFLIAYLKTRNLPFRKTHILKKSLDPQIIL